MVCHCTDLGSAFARALRAVRRCWLRNNLGHGLEHGFSCALLAVLAALPLAACSRPAQPEPALQALKFEYAGCSSVRRGPVCVLDATRELTIWVEGAGAEVFAEGEQLVLLESQSIDGGRRSRVRVPPAARSIELRGAAAGAALQLAELDEPPPLRQARELRQAGEWQRARELLERSMYALEPIERERARALLARLLLAKGEAQAAAQELEATWRTALEAGLLSEAADDLLATVYIHAVRLRDYARARRNLEQVTVSFSGLPRTRAQVPYFEGLLSVRVGDVGAALLQFRKAVHLARRLGLDSDAAAAQQELALALGNLGRTQDALAEQRALVDTLGSEPGCAQASALAGLVWLQLRAEVGAEGVLESLGRVERALQRCPNPASHYNHELNAAYAAAQRRDPTEAERRLSSLRAKGAAPNPRLAAWTAELWAELELARGNFKDCVSAFEDAERLARSAAQSEQAYRALVGLGRCHELTKRPQRALDSYLRAEQLARDLVRGVPFGEGQQLVGLELEQSARLALGVLLGRGDVVAAYRMARDARERLLAADWRRERIAGLDDATRKRWEQAIAEYHQRVAELEASAKEDWQLSAEKLAGFEQSRQLQAQSVRSALAEAYALLPNGAEQGQGTDLVARSGAPSCVALAAQRGQATLLLARSSDAWVAFLCTGTGVEAAPLKAEGWNSSRELTAPELDAFARALARQLQSFSDAGRFAGVSLLRVAAHPLLERVDVHALSLGEAPLGSRLPVAYVLDPETQRGIDAGDDLERLRDGSRPVLIVSDPSLDLPLARDEARLLRSLFSGATHLAGAAAAEAPVSSALTTAVLMHFAGHAEYGGVDGIESSLVLGTGDRLELGEVLSLSRAPRYVVLSACEAAGSAQKHSAGLSIGQAFLAAGSSVVVAPSRTVLDRDGHAFTTTLYRNLAGLDSSAWGVAIQRAWEDLRLGAPQGDWSSFRLLIP